VPGVVVYENESFEEALKINEIKKEIENIKTICDVDPMNFL